jgi:Fe-S-cluster formation regulator IscX/YfhJ
MKLLGASRVLTLVRYCDLHILIVGRYTDYDDDPQFHEI